MRDFTQPKEFEDDYTEENVREVYNQNGLRITYSEFMNNTYVLKTDLYSVILMRVLNIWAISFIEAGGKFLTDRCCDLPDFMKSFNGHAVRKFKSAKEVDGLIKRFLGLKAFL